MDLPEAVKKVKEQLNQDPTDALSEVATRLINNSPELISMWKSLSRRKSGDDDLWVWAFLGAAHTASQQPPYTLLPAYEKKMLSNRITATTQKLIKLIQDNDLDANLVHLEGQIFNGFYIYEDFDYTNRVRIIEDKHPLLSFTALLSSMADRSGNEITSDPTPVRSGKTAQAVHFIRTLAHRNKQMYNGKVLNQVIATATNAIFDTEYNVSDIRNLLNRQKAK